jgi:transmembrane sensor
MSDIVRLKTQTQIDNEAAVWTWRRDSGELTAAERGELEAWLRADARHRRTFEDMAATWNMLDRLVERPQDPKTAALARLERRRGFPRRRYWEAAAAAVLCVALGTGLWVLRRPGTQVLATAVGQQRHARLADGSQVTLNTNTLLAVRLTARRRDIYLRRGEAHFDVVHDAARPFFVHAGDAVIRDVGTQFEVWLRSDRDVDVLVDEGRVEVRGSAAAAEAADSGGSAGGQGADQGADQGAGWVKPLSAGEQLLITGPHLKILAVSPQQVAADLAWREGALVFNGQPLSQALTEVARYTRSRIVVVGPTVGSLHISGRFRTDDVPGFFQALQAALPVRVSRPEPGLVYIAPR